MINQKNININTKIILYYSLNQVYFNRNNLTIYQDNELNYKIVNYNYNDLQMNELILINNNLFLVKGLDSFNIYNLQLLNNNFNEITKDICGYYSLGIIDYKDEFIIDKNIEPLIYISDTSILNLGDYYMKNKTLYILNENDDIIPDIFIFKEKGTYFKLLCINNRYYYFNNFNFIKVLDNLFINNILYKIKFILNHEIIFYVNQYDSLKLDDGFYNFYYPYQPFKLVTIKIDGNGLINNTF